MIGIVSDIHGNYPALQAVLGQLDALGCEQIISLGDVAGYYPFINECCTLLRARGALSVLGNHDHYLSSGLGCSRSVSANLCLDYQRKVISPENMHWLSGLPHELVVEQCSLVHGGWINSFEEYVESPDSSYFATLPFRLFVSGHTHVQGLWELGTQTYCNPGSVGQPRDQDWRAAFATLVGGRFTLHRTEYDVDETITRMRSLGFPEAYSSNLKMGTRIGGNTVREEIR